MTAFIHGRFEHGFAWLARPEHFMRQSSTALAHEGRVWLIDPLRAEGIDDEIAALGKPAGVIATIGWHDRDVDWFAALHGVPVYGARHLRNVLFQTPLARVDGTVPGTPFRLINTSMGGLMGWWTESAVWWPEESVLVTGDSVGRAPYYVRPGEKLAVHPIVRLAPPTSLRGLRPRRVFCGHGDSVHEGAAEALEHALGTARSELIPAWRHAFSSGWRGAV
jgi:hypothetical protein